MISVNFILLVVQVVYGTLFWNIYLIVAMDLPIQIITTIYKYSGVLRRYASAVVRVIMTDRSI